ncbi:MAG: transcription termination factor NusA [Chloroflexota bacterium]
MKSEFLLAFNEICQERGLPQETVIEALKTALVSAYRRNTNVSNTQGVSVEIDPRSGEPTIYAEKEVVDSIIDNRTEVLREVAHAQGFTEADYGDMVMVDSTPRNFGRIAAQTAKQVILQRVREAERDQLFDDFASREGEIVNGTVQSTSGSSITIGLGRTEATLPGSQQVKTERYRAHDKIRVYVLEVRKTNRGPSIIVSRSHRNLLRRLLELEVPEIYNGQVDIKSIAREAGQRSKVAVVALQPGVDPVGACVGMRGVRIQSIVRELNDEKIDVIEWDPNQKNFIAKSLSPARVSGVYLEEHPDNGKTAVVIVPDDQLSLAIGREGQNARLAAKLTGWRIDIKSLTEAASDSLDMLDHSAVDPEVAADKELHSLAQLVIEKRRQNRPITAEDYKTLERLVNGVEGKIIAERAEKYEQIRKDRSEARKKVPNAAWNYELEELNLLLRYHNALLESGIKTVGDVLYQLELGHDTLLHIEGFGDKALESLLVAVDEFKERVKEEQEAAEAEAAELEVEVGTDEAVADAEVPVAEVESAAKPAEEPEDDVDFAAVMAAGSSMPMEAAKPAEEAEAPTAEVAEAVVEDAETVEETDEESEAEAEVEEVEAVVEEAAEPAEAAVESDQSTGLTPLVPLVKEEEKAEQPKKKVVVVRKPKTQDKEDSSAATGKKKGRELIFDEDAGRVVTKRKRKGSRRRNEWDDIDDF